MEAIKNTAFYLQLSDLGFVDKLSMNEDRKRMNWVIDKDYMAERGYPDEDKLFGHFSLRVNQVLYNSSETGKPVIARLAEKWLEVVYAFEPFEVRLAYDLETDDTSMRWNISIVNKSSEPLTVDHFYMWSSLAYVMFKDADVMRNIDHSCAVFPSISPNFSKLACVRRSNLGPHLGVYAVKGITRSVGTYCRFENNFFKNVSPSLDGMLYHSLILVGTGSVNSGSPSSSDWIYGTGTEPVELAAGHSLEWEYVLMPFADQQQFYDNGLKLGHPALEYSPVVVSGGQFQASFQLPGQQRLTRAWVESFEGDRCKQVDVTDQLGQINGKFLLQARLAGPGERKLGIELENGTVDHVVFNVIEPIRTIIESRVEYICRNLYQNEGAEVPHAFLPLSNQGESLGKLALVLKKNEIGSFEQEQIRKVENSAVHYIRPKWFVNGDFYQPAKLYGTFYRIIDLDYIAHIYYLLSKFTADQLVHHEPSDYLQWAAEVMVVRFDENLHADEREKEETHMPGVYSLFIKDLLDDLKRNDRMEAYERLSSLWSATGERLRAGSELYTGAVTEHFYDNAGFGPTCEILSLSGHTNEADRYGELLLANIGFSNDFRAQNPDRWWEALSYMTHSLWGGLVAASTLVAYEHIKRTEYLTAAYRGTMPVFYCYDWHATATDKKLEKGQAASTYSVAGPNMNRPDLSRNRFGQSVFAKDGGLFEQLFSNASGDDWDMGEELVAYLEGFGTKTFLYTQNGELRCVNGEIVRTGDRYEVTSYAAYPREFHFYEAGESFVAAPGQEVRTVIFENGAFIPSLLSRK
ncbi:hypothetical protein [Paenibacillus abyssi]|uniref:Uncharacterized protein n=1 Tax=Paenibacillus abyssi TaxID=1340531 RepID=A0A917FW67_9BACL|nr:hypothetical protein [Paenibacillus abyssi]GGG08619.1 hypothetical protein GCM10010916_26850 [Paenibacillus abyssi]